MINRGEEIAFSYRKIIINIEGMMKQGSHILEMAAMILVSNS